MAGPAIVGIPFLSGPLTGIGTASLTSGSTTIGNGLFVWGYLQGGSTGYTGVTIADGGNTWNVRTVFRNVGRSVFCAWTTIASGNAGARSIVVTGTGGSGGMFGGVAGAEFTIPGPISADQIGSGTGFGASPAVVTAGGADVGTTDLAFGAIAIGGGGANSNIATPPATGYTNVYGNNNDSTDSSGELAYRINTTSVTDSATWTVGGFGVDGSAAAVWSFQFGGGGGGVTVALTGISATGSVGTLGVSHAQALTGVAGTSAIGTVVPNTAVALSGNAGTGSVGSVTPSTSKALTGIAGTGALGTLTPNTSVPLTGVQATGSVGTVSASTSSDVTVALSGIAATGSVGTVAPSTAVALTGNTSTGQLGTLAPDHAQALTGNATIGAVGTLVPARAVALTGLSATGQMGNVATQGDVTVALTGFFAIGSMGILLPSGGDTGSGGVDVSGGGHRKLDFEKLKKKKKQVKKRSWRAYEIIEKLAEVSVIKEESNLVDSAALYAISELEISLKEAQIDATEIYGELLGLEIARLEFERDEDEDDDLLL